MRYDVATMKKLLSLCLATTFALGMILSSGCATDYSGSAYDPEFVRQPHSVQYGTITRMAYAQVQGQADALGGIAGGVVGGALGHTVGGGSGKVLATAVGTVGGAAIGAAAQKKAGTQDVVEFTILLDGSDTEFSLVQNPGPDTFAVGQRVRVLTASNGVTRIRPE
jgi:outer membrane lipoprotein SlyB